MVAVEETDAGLYAVDAAKRELAVRAVGWEATGTPRALPRHVDEVVAGRASELRFPDAAVNIEEDRRGRWTVLGNELGSSRLDPGDYTLKVNAAIVVYVRFGGGATIDRSGRAGEVALRFPEPTPVTLGFRSGVRSPTGNITVPPTPEGVATALTHLPVAIETTGPEKSYPSLRRHPPAVELGDEVSVPDDLRERLPDTGIELRLPADLASPFVAAPLAYYLQASVSVGEGERPRIVASEVGLDRALDPFPAFEREVAGLLRRVFLLDCLVRNAGRYGTDLAELSALSDLPLDADRAYAATPAERLATYLETPFERVESTLPEWHLAMYVDPIPAHVPTLPWQLDRLCAIYRPDSTPLGRAELVTRSLGDSYRSGASGRDGAPLLSPRFHAARLHGWLADGDPVDAFKALPEAYDNRLDYLGEDRADKRVRVVLNDPEMEREQVSVGRIYGERATDLSIDVDVRRGLDREALADLLATPAEFVHYIGHCTDRGLQCSDGYLSAADLPTCAVETFFLNGCGSYREGLELVRRGSVAGGVTLRDVLDRQATRVGTAFAQLVIHGFSIERALRIARRRSIVSKGYVAVGDGTHTLSQADDQFPGLLEVESLPSGRFAVTTETFSPGNPGAVYQSYIADDEEKHLFGNPATLEVDRSALSAHLRRAAVPVVYDGRYRWSDRLADALSSGE